MMKTTRESQENVSLAALSDVRSLNMLYRGNNTLNSVTGCFPRPFSALKIAHDEGLRVAILSDYSSRGLKDAYIRRL